MSRKKVHLRSNEGRNNNSRLKPFLKWPGGKRWFVNKYGSLLPRTFNCYIEPFLGSGAVFFHLRPDRAILGDSNTELVNTYFAIKSNWKLVFRYLRQHHSQHSRNYYYKIRDSRPRSEVSRAARFIYLNRTSWNGLYRVNRAGIFNVPIGTRSTVVFDYDDFEGISRVLANADLHSSDFETLINMAQKGDLVFVDPPYTVRHNNNSFIKYNEKLFSWTDQERLFNALQRAKYRGAYVVGTNACHRSLKKLYQGTFDTRSVKRNSLISSKAESRGIIRELVIYTES